MKIAFCFPGQGSQAEGMGRELAESFPEARAVYDEASAAVGIDIAGLCFDGTLAELTETQAQQPALVATCVACLRAVEARGVRPDAVIGHSVGEYSALAAAGSIDPGDAVALVRERGEAMAATARENPGAMAAIIGLEEEVVEELCDATAGVWLANFNCPGQVVVSGLSEPVATLLAEASQRGARRTVPLRISGAFHSPLVAAAAERLRPRIEAIVWRQPAVAFMSTVTARLEQAPALPAVLVSQLTAPVRFTQAIRRLLDLGVDTFVEIGPGQVLSGLIKRCDRTVSTLSVGDLSGLEKLDDLLGAVRQ